MILCNFKNIETSGKISLKIKTLVNSLKFGVTASKNTYIRLGRQGE